MSRIDADELEQRMRDAIEAGTAGAPELAGDPEPDGTLPKMPEPLPPESVAAAPVVEPASVEALAKAPDDNPKTKFGLMKPSMANVPPVSILHMMGVFFYGALKYGRFNWRTKRVSSTIYYDAAMRHLMAWSDGEDHDPETGMSHLAHAMSCCAIILDAQSLGMLNDNRGPFGAFGELQVDHTKALPK